MCKNELVITTDLALAQRLERDSSIHLLEYVLGLERLHLHQPQAQHGLGLGKLLAGGVMVRTGDALGINTAVGLGLYDPVSEAQLDQLEQFFFAAQLPARLELCPLANHALIKRLANRHYTVTRFVDVLVRQILPHEHFVRRNEIEVSKVQWADLETWLEVVQRGFGTRSHSDIHSDQPSRTALVNARLGQIAFHRPNSHCFVAKRHGQVVGTGALVVREDGDGWRLGTLYMASTSPEARGHGVQSALLQARLEAASLADCDTMMVQATPGHAAHRNLERAGFHVAYTRVVLERKSNHEKK